MLVGKHNMTGYVASWLRGYRGHHVSTSPLPFRNPELGWNFPSLQLLGLPYDAANV